MLIYYPKERKIVAADIEFNLSNNTNYKLEIAGYPNLTYFVTSTQLPQMSMQPVQTDFRGNQCIVPGDKIEYDSLTVEFLVNEDWANYIELYKWIKDQRWKNNPKDHFSDLTLWVLNNNKLPITKIVYYDAFPTSVSELDFDSSTTEPVNLMCSVTFSYQSFSLFKGDVEL